MKRVGSNIKRLRTCQCVGVQFSSRLHGLDHEEQLSGGLSKLPSTAKVVICGGGVMGASVAYHLAKRGWGDKTILIEKERYV